jgi:excisionase family DNA binding protein
MKQLLREPAEAKRIGVSARTLRDWRARRLVPFIKIGRVVLFDSEQVDLALKKFERKTA